MGSFEVHPVSGKSSGRRPACLKIVRSGGRIKPRIIHTFSPKVYKIEPEEFLDLVQKLTGRRSAPEDSTSTGSRLSNPGNDDEEKASDRGEVIAGTPVSTQLLASLPSPRLVTLNFLPMLSASSPSSFNHSMRDLEPGFTFPSSAY